jgi:hypothetical protein
MKRLRRQRERKRRSGAGSLPAGGLSPKGNRSNTFSFSSIWICSRDTRRERPHTPLAVSPQRQRRFGERCFSGGCSKHPILTKGFPLVSREGFIAFSLHHPKHRVPANTGSGGRSRFDPWRDDWCIPSTPKSIRGCAREKSQRVDNWKSNHLGLHIHPSILERNFLKPPTISLISFGPWANRPRRKSCVRAGLSVSRSHNFSSQPSLRVRCRLFLLSMPATSGAGRAIRLSWQSISLLGSREWVAAKAPSLPRPSLEVCVNPRV